MEVGEFQSRRTLVKEGTVMSHDLGRLHRSSLLAAPERAVGARGKECPGEGISVDRQADGLPCG